VSSDQSWTFSPLEVADAQHDGSFEATSTRECPQPRRQFGERERLGQIVVSAGIQPGDPVNAPPAT
jgi:hypothetical protein